MKFDYVIGNPPYQEVDGGSGASATPVYNKFIEETKTLNPTAMSFIIPAKWYSGGKGLDEFREQMLNDKRMAVLVDYPNSLDVFPNVDVAGGVCYFVWAKSHEGKCYYINYRDGVKTSEYRDLNEFSTFIRYPIAAEIVKKVRLKGEQTLDTIVSSRKPFGLATNVKPLKAGDIQLRFNGGIGPYKRSLISTGIENIDRYKIIISYLTAEDAALVTERIVQLAEKAAYDDSFWEEALYKKDRMIVAARVVHACDVVEINTYEQLRDLDSDSEQLKSDAIAVIAKQLQADPKEIVEISVLKKGMTNRSFLFSCKGKKYIMRIPGEGTSQLISRKEEADVYRAISGKEICDDPIYINPENGYKITSFLEGVRPCDPLNVSDLKKCMNLLKKFHQMELTVDHEFDIFKQIEFYESLWEGAPSIYRDYQKTKENVLSLKPYIEAHAGKKVLTHIDAVPDNFLFCAGEDGEQLQLTDWEYAGMQDPHVDIAMFCIYSLYNKRQIDRLISIYFEGDCPNETRVKIYCYIATCGLLWSNWCEYKRSLGVEFGEYSLRQYRFAKEYYRIASEEIKKL